MHKITKGLKKKKKGKKSKHKDEELFKPEELEAYRKEHQATEEPTSSGKNEEWKKFLALTSGVDDILHKTKDDLDRIKSTSFFQRVPPPSETQKQEEEVKTEEKPPEPQLGIVEVSESESDEEDEDDIFDTAYIDAIATGEVKLAYIPDSPTKEEGDDPFDTSYAERAILGPAAERKGKKLVPIGAAVEVLTGRVQLPTCATKRPVNRRQILKERDLLLGSFDDNANNVAASPEQIQKTLLDDDEIPIPDEPIDLSKTLHPITPVVEEVKESKTQSIVKEFEEDEDDAEFAALAAESLHKEPKVISEVVIPQLEPVQVDGNWNAAFEDSTACTVEEVVDPFDTTFAENILPGKAELRIIENEVLNDDFDFNPREEDTLKTILKTVNVSQTNKTLNAEPIKNDLLGGSNTDLTQLNSDVLRPSETKDENYIEYGDPFDTSIVESAKQPGQTELKFLEREFLGEIKVQQLSFEDDDFDPRAGESRGRSVSRPEVLNFSKTVSFDVSSPTQSNLDVDQRVSKPLTPFYVRKSSVPEEVFSPEEPEDPFDTSFVSKVTPGKAELKLIENELFVERNLSLSDQDFDPRDEKKVAIAQVVQSIQGIKDPTKVVEEEKVEIDLLSADTNIPGKVLTPNLEPVRQQQEELSYVDPFDTSIACNILPGKTELKLLETELIEKVVPKVPSDPDFNLRGTADLISHTGDTIFEKPLSPNKVSFDIEEDYDPFDTSIANNIQPGKQELKLLESELI
ncbi:unnamed protein product [Brassicogethes aeneus]|uniref:Protein stoned-A n=1 Tax=Brassicogethes aeneus TaxID=1431903 RepID=A0A9P0FL73_BRAAE|nr:unnamed protein product [Brassicogethes aeneus]